MVENTECSHLEYMFHQNSPKALLAVTSVEELSTEQFILICAPSATQNPTKNSQFSQL